MARLDRRVIGQALAVVVGIAIGFFATRTWRHAPEEPPAQNPEPAASATRPEPVEVEPVAPEPESETPEQQQAAQRAEYDAYLERHDYSRESLIAIALLSGELDDLIEAAERYPEDPAVQLLVIGEAKFPGDKSEWFQRFRDSQPDNLLAALLLGSHQFKQGQEAQALEALRTGATQSIYRDFGAEHSMAMESALLEFGHSPLEAKQKSSGRSPLGLTLPVQVQEAIIALDQLAESREEAAQREELILLGAAIGNQLSQGAAKGSNVNRMFGLTMERQFLKKLDPDLESESLSGTPAAALDEIRSDWERISDDTDFVLDHLDQLDETQKLHYFDRQRSLGDANATEWLRTQFSP